MAGINVPRPPDTNATLNSQKFGKRREMGHLIMKHAREQLLTTAKGDPEHVYKALMAHLASLDVSWLKRKDWGSAQCSDRVVVQWECSDSTVVQ